MESFKTFFSKQRFGRFETLLKHREVLQEGLITSYPFKNVLSFISRKYKGVITHIQTDIFHNQSKTAGISFWIDNSNLTDNFLKDLNSELKVYGYFVAHTTPYNSTETGIFIEPKYSFLLDNKTLKNKRCFHITHENFLPKIEKVGLIPRNSQTHFNFEGSRIYLMFGDDETFSKSFMFTLAKSKNWNVKDLKLLEILNFDTIKLYYDMNFDNDKGNLSTFTFDNISKDNLKVLI